MTQPSPSSTDLPPIMKFGDNGDIVADFQSMLSRHGYPLQPDGDFGFLTRAVVIAFKEKHGLSVDGIAGPHTYEVLVR